MYIYVYICQNLFMRKYLCVYIYIDVCVYLSLYIFTYIFIKLFLYLHVNNIYIYVFIFYIYVYWEDWGAGFRILQNQVFWAFRIWQKTE